MTANLVKSRQLSLDNFRVNVGSIDYHFWMQLGEAKSKCGHLSKAPLLPERWSNLHMVYLVKGVHATTAIEGNTLSEEEVLAIYRRESTLPPSREYQQQEVENVLQALGDSFARESPSTLTVEELCEYNARVMYQLEVPAHVLPGQFRADSVSVGRYLCPRPHEVPGYIEHFIRWYNEFSISETSMHPFSAAIIKAIAAHVYFVLIHPFGDGNGRTARLLEWRTLDAAGIPTPATHLLSNHYNLTRSRYYEMLDRASQYDDIQAFFCYAVQGLVDGLAEQLKEFYSQYEDLVYGDIVRQKVPGTNHDLVRRRQELAIAIRKANRALNRSQIRYLTPELAAVYARSERTLSRDLTELVTAQLLQRDAAGAYEPNLSNIFWRHQRQ
jgi:Fic family protein